MKVYKCATGLIVMADTDYACGDYIDGAGTIVEVEKEEDIFSRRDELVERSRSGDRVAMQLLLDNWGDF